MALSYLTFFLDWYRSPSIKLPKIGDQQPPPIGEYKLNVDGALFFDHQMVSVGAILRNDNGDILLAASMRELTLMQSEHIECLAILKGLQICLQLGISTLIVEFDCLLLVQELQQTGEFGMYLGHILLDIKQMMARFSHISMKFCYRECNGIAHKLAKYA